MAQIRVSPDGSEVAIRNGNHPRYPWRVSTGDIVGDGMVASWPKLALRQIAYDEGYQDGLQEGRCDPGAL